MAIGTRLKTQAKSNAASRERTVRIMTITTKHMRMLPLARYREKRVKENTSTPPPNKQKISVARKSRMLHLAKRRFQLPTQPKKNDKKSSIDAVGEDEPPIKYK